MLAVQWIHKPLEVNGVLIFLQQYISTIELFPSSQIITALLTTQQYSECLFILLYHVNKQLCFGSDTFFFTKKERKKD
jgi:hypothetical protein